MSWRPTPLMYSAPVDAAAFKACALKSAAAEGKCNPDTLAKLRAFLDHPLTRGILDLTPDRLDGFLANDLYKPRMHGLYATSLAGVRMDFALNVRKTPVPLASIRAEDPELWAAFEAACARRLGVPPYPPKILATLSRHFGGFALPPAALQRAERDGVAAPQWEEAGGTLCAFACGPAEAASHVESTMTQLVEEVVIAAQVRRLERERGVRLCPEELLGSALAALALGVEKLNAEAHKEEEGAENGEQGVRMVLFAGRRSSSRRYLVLQNWYCRLHMRGYAGTSSVLAAALLDDVAQQAQQQVGIEECRLLAATHLVGTLAHEIIMGLDQMLAPYNQLPGSTTVHGGTADGDAPGSGTAQICALLAHLLMLHAAGGLPSATALADTFGTAAFVAAALACRLPEQFRGDMARLFPKEWAALPACCSGADAVVFDLFRVWRVDSGEYEQVATLIVDAWQRRWSSFPPVVRPPCPLLMHSNLSSYEEVVATARLPKRIRPRYLCFGTLADGFLPFNLPEPTRPGAATAGKAAAVAANGAELAGGASVGSDDGEAGGASVGSDDGVVGGSAPAHTAAHAASVNSSRSTAGVVEIRLASVVMKAVQARHAFLPPGWSAESAGKLGDPSGGGKGECKLQLDPRMPVEAQERTVKRLRALFAATSVDGEAGSAALAAAYTAITQENLLE